MWRCFRLRRGLVLRSRDGGGESHYGIKTISMVFEVVAVMIRQSVLKNNLWQMFLGCEWGIGEKGSDHEVWSFFLSFFLMTHMNSVT